MHAKGIPLPANHVIRHCPNYNFKVLAKGRHRKNYVLTPALCHFVKQIFHLYPAVSMKDGAAFFVF